MKLNQESVFNAAQAIYGDAVSEVIIAASCERMCKMLRRDISENLLEEFRGRIEYVAALIAVRDAFVADSVSAPAEIKAGEISVKNNLSSDGISQLISEEIQELSPVITDRSFVFRAILEETPWEKI